MADTARVVFLAFRSSSDPMSQAWTRFRESVSVATDLSPAQTGAEVAIGTRSPGSGARPSGSPKPIESSRATRIGMHSGQTGSAGGSGAGGAGASGAGVSGGSGASAAGVSGAGVSGGAGASAVGVSGAGVLGVGVVGAGLSAAGVSGAGVSGARLSGAGVSSTGVWRILATNNRELCRAAHVYPSFGRARGHVLRLRERIGELVVVPVVGPRPGSRGWYMTLGGVAVVTCGRWYGSTASSAEAAEASLEALRTAVIADAARELTPAPRSPRAAAGADLTAW